MGSGRRACSTGPRRRPRPRPRWPTRRRRSSRARPASTRRQARLALEHGCHTLVEKPLALTAAEADPLVALADERGLVLGVAMNLRFHPGVIAVRDAVALGRHRHAARRAGLVRVVASGLAARDGLPAVLQRTPRARRRRAARRHPRDRLPHVDPRADRQPCPRRSRRCPTSRSTSRTSRSSSSGSPPALRACCRWTTSTGRTTAGAGSSGRRERSPGRSRRTGHDRRGGRGDRDGRRPAGRHEHLSGRGRGLHRGCGAQQRAERGRRRRRLSTPRRRGGQELRVEFSCGAPVARSRQALTPSRRAAALRPRTGEPVRGCPPATRRARCPETAPAPPTTRTTGSRRPAR